MYRVKADLNLCQGYANCVLKAPGIVDLDQTGIVTILRQEIDDGDLSAAEEAVASCPVSALSIERA